MKIYKVRNIKGTLLVGRLWQPGDKFEIKVKPAILRRDTLVDVIYEDTLLGRCNIHALDPEHFELVL